MRCFDPVEDTTVVGGDIMLMIYYLVFVGFVIVIDIATKE